MAYPIPPAIAPAAGRVNELFRFSLEDPDALQTPDHLIR